MGVTKNVMGVTQLIANYSLIDGAKSDPYDNFNRGTHPIYHDAIHFYQLSTWKSHFFWVGFDENYPNMRIKWLNCLS